MRGKRRQTRDKWIDRERDGRRMKSIDGRGEREPQPSMSAAVSKRETNVGANGRKSKVKESQALPLLIPCVHQSVCHQRLVGE